jgi:hypothetical protein
MMKDSETPFCCEGHAKEFLRKSTIWVRTLKLFATPFLHVTMFIYFYMRKIAESYNFNGLPGVGKMH